MNEFDEEAYMKAMREHYGFPDPPAPQQNPLANIEQKLDKAEMIWDYMLSKSGTMPNVLDNDK